MILAGMIHADETALICDMAETYHVLDWRALPIHTAAALASGLREDSRVRLRMSGQKADAQMMLLAAAVDRLSFLAWAQTKDAERGVNRPASIVAAMTAETETAQKEYNVYRSPEAFDDEWKRLTGGV